MNKTAIKNYAIWARVQLIEAAKQSAYEYEITENGENKTGLDMVGGRLLTKTEKEQRNQLISELNRKGFSQVMEEAAYTWFNRFIALRFMEVNGYLPSKVRVFTDENGAFRPEILKQAMSVELEGLDRSKVLDLLDRQDNEALYKYLLITQCNALNSGLPYMFEKIANWTELLFPANLLRQDSVLGQMISEIPEEDWTDAVQIIGWLYQAYYSDPKDARINAHKKYSKNDIPYVTQLFTPDWIVRYMVENSLGRLWYEGHSDFDKTQWHYYLDESEQEPEVEAQLQKIRAEYATIKPEGIKIIDPCMGSGHILVYAFDVLMQIYTSAGWSERDAAKSILENNLFGLDIDDRAGQLAYFAVMMKARKYSRRILNGDVQPNVFSIQESNWMTDEFISYVAGKDTDMKDDLIMLRETFRDSKEYGSILNVPPMRYSALYERIDIISRSYAEDLFQAQFRTMVAENLLPLVRQSQIMSQKYDVVVTNPPYMNSSLMPDKLKRYVQNKYPCSKNDLFATFIVKSLDTVKKDGFVSMLTPYVWMFISSYEELRSYINQEANIDSLIQLEYNAFEAACVPVGCFTLRKTTLRYSGEYIKLSEFRGSENQGPKVIEAIQDKHCGYRFQANQNDFIKIPGSPIAYWVSSAFFSNFTEQNRLTQYGAQKTRVCTGDNEKFLRLWFEIKDKDTFYPQKWVPYPKGGTYRKWYGNLDYVVDYENNGERLYEFKGAMPGDRKYHLKEGITWSALTSGDPSFRFVPKGCICDQKGPLLYIYDRNNLNYLLGTLNCTVAKEILRVVAPTLDYIWGSIAKVPVVMDLAQQGRVSSIVSECVDISKTDWNAMETSYGFTKNPLV